MKTVIKKLKNIFNTWLITGRKNRIRTDIKTCCILSLMLKIKTVRMHKLSEESQAHIKYFQEEK